MGSMGHVVHSGVSGEHNGDVLFFMFGWGPVRIQQKTREDLLRQSCVFLHLVGSAGRAVHSGASGA
jgi:hypothetical protein